MSPKLSDYDLLLKEYGLTQEQVDKEVLADNIIDVDWQNDLELKPSPIHGLGIFATANLWPGEFIGDVRRKDKRTKLGRYINHSPEPNVRFHGGSELMFAVTTRAVAKGEEIVLDYRQALELHRANV